MALINCPECGKEVSDVVENCPHCGYPIKKSLKNVEKKPFPIKIVGISGGLVLLAIIVAVVLIQINKLSPEEQACVDRVTEAITAIGVVTTDSEKSIQTAEDLYAELSDRCKKKVENYELLVSARENYNELRAKETSDLITAIGEITVDSQKAIDTAKESYDALSEEQKALVVNSEAIPQAYDEITAIRVKSVEDLIDSIGVVSDDSNLRIQTARKAFDNLPDDDKGRVSNQEVLVNAEKEFSDLVVEKTIVAIDNIGVVTLESGDKINEAKSAYNNLPKELESKISNYSVLTEAERTYDQLVKEEEERLRTLNPGDTFSTKKWEITYKRANITAKILPNSTSGYYMYYYTGDDETYIDLVFQIKNIDIDILGIDELAKNCRVEYNGSTLTKGCTLFVSSGNDIDKVYSWDGLGALNSTTLHVAITMPREIQTNGKSLTVHLNIAGQEKTIHVRE